MAGKLKLTEAQQARLRALARNGRITKEDVLDDATTPESPLHPLFEWDDSEAAKKYRIGQAMTVIESFRTVVSTREVTLAIPFFWRDASIPGNESGYVSLTQLASEPDTARRVLIAEFERVLGYLKRARTAAIGLGFVEDVDELLARTLGLKRIVAGEVEAPEAPEASGSEAPPPVQ